MRIPPFISNYFKLPVTRVEVLKRAKKSIYKDFGLCALLKLTLLDYDIRVTQLQLEKIFPKYNISNAKKFNGCKYGDGFWWHAGDWTTGRMDFLNWLIEEYENDNTNLRALYKSICISG